MNSIPDFKQLCQRRRFKSHLQFDKKSEISQFQVLGRWIEKTDPQTAQTEGEATA